MDAKTQKIINEIQEMLKEYINGSQIVVDGNSVNFSVPMQFGENNEPAPVMFSSRIEENYVETICVMTHDFFDQPADKEPPIDFYKLMNILNLRTKGSCVYFYTENALVCSAIAPCPVGFDKDVYWFNTYNLLDTVGRFTPSFYGLLNGHVTFDQLLKLYQESNM